MERLHQKTIIIIEENTREVMGKIFAIIDDDERIINKYKVITCFHPSIKTTILSVLRSFSRNVIFYSDLKEKLKIELETNEKEAYLLLSISQYTTNRTISIKESNKFDKNLTEREKVFINYGNYTRKKT